MSEQTARNKLLLISFKENICMAAVLSLVGCAGNTVTNFSQLQSSEQGGKVQAHYLSTMGSYVELFQRSYGGFSEEKCYLIFRTAHLESNAKSVGIKQRCMQGATGYSIAYSVKFKP